LKLSSFAPKVQKEGCQWQAKRSLWLQCVVFSRIEDAPQLIKNFQTVSTQNESPVSFRYAG